MHDSFTHDSCMTLSHTWDMPHDSCMSVYMRGVWLIDICVWLIHLSVTCLINIRVIYMCARDTTHPYMRNLPYWFTCDIWVCTWHDSATYVWFALLIYVWHICVYVTWLIHTRVYVTWLIQICVYVTWLINNAMCVYVTRLIHTCVTWLEGHDCSFGHRGHDSSIYVWYDSFIYAGHDASIYDWHDSVICVWHDLCDTSAGAATSDIAKW